MEESFLFLLLSYALTLPSPRGRGRLPKNLGSQANAALKRVLTKQADWFIIRHNRRIGI